MIFSWRASLTADRTAIAVERLSVWRSEQLTLLISKSSIENSEMQTRSFITLKEAMKRVCTKWDWLSKKHFTGSTYEGRCRSTIAIGFFHCCKHLRVCVCVQHSANLFFFKPLFQAARFDYSDWMAKILATPEHDKEASFANFSSALALPSKIKEACSSWILNHWVHENFEVILDSPML